MCANCLTTFDVVVSQALAVGMILKRPVQDRLAVAGLVRPFDQLGEHANTVAFLRSLDLDPVEILGPEVVEAAATWQRAPWSRRRFRLTNLLPTVALRA
jgi:hypothetical protein